MPSPIDLFILALTIILPLAWYYRNSLPLIGSRAVSASLGGPGGSARKGIVEEGDPRDFVGKMERGVSTARWLLATAMYEGPLLTKIYLCCIPPSRSLRRIVM
jgi:hypothetical protein